MSRTNGLALFRTLTILYNINSKMQELNLQDNNLGPVDVTNYLHVHMHVFKRNSQNDMRLNVFSSNMSACFFSVKFNS